MRLSMLDRRSIVGAPRLGATSELSTSRLQNQSVEGLKRLTVRDVPALELIFLDALAAHLIGPEAPEPPYTIEHGTAIASLLLRSVADAPGRDIGAAPEG